MAKHTLHCVTIVCGQCEKDFTYYTKANCQKMFCPDCSKSRINISKRESKERIQGKARAGKPKRKAKQDDLTKEEIEEMLDKIPDREIGWNSYFNIISKGTP